MQEHVGFSVCLGVCLGVCLFGFGCFFMRALLKDLLNIEVAVEQIFTY